MCLITYDSNPRYSAKPITVYKVVNLEYRYGVIPERELSAYFHPDFKYTLGKEFTEQDFDMGPYLPEKIVTLGRFSTSAHRIDKGFHSFQTLRRACEEVKKCKQANARRTDRPNYVVLKCVIPANTPYYKGVQPAEIIRHSYYEYCSKSIIPIAWTEDTERQKEEEWESKCELEWITTL